MNNVKQVSEFFNKHLTEFTKNLVIVMDNKLIQVVYVSGIITILSLISKLVGFSLLDWKAGALNTVCLYFVYYKTDTERGRFNGESKSSSSDDRNS